MEAGADPDCHANAPDRDPLLGPHAPPPPLPEAGGGGIRQALAVRGDPVGRVRTRRPGRRHLAPPPRDRGTPSRPDRRFLPGDLRGALAEAVRGGPGRGAVADGEPPPATCRPPRRVARD